MPTALYNESFDSRNFLKQHGYWMYADGVSRFDYESNRAKERFSVQNGALTITCKKEDEDFSRLGFHPRAELRLDRIRFRAENTYRVVFECRLGQPQSTFEFWQLMCNKLPVIQLECRKGFIGVRYKKGRDLTVMPVMPVTMGDMRWQVDFHVSKKDAGYAKIWLNGVSVWQSAVGLPVKEEGGCWIQYGVYLNQPSTRDQSVLYNSMRIEMKK